jgi:S-adenosylmethionine:tRNA ribosyltransferase-isomerase
VGERPAGGNRLWVAEVITPVPLLAYLSEAGRPIRYGPTRTSWPLAAYQTVFAAEPGSAEMPSAARAFTPELVARLVAAGVVIVPITLHTGVSSQEAGEPPYEERYRVPAASAAVINAARGAGGRVVAVGTTVTRALETVADEAGRVHPGQGWTNHVVSPRTGARSVDGIISGWHEPEASHLMMLEAIAGRERLEQAYGAALERRYRWHEFGDLVLLLS